MAQRGASFLRSESGLLTKLSFQLFVNEIILGNNTCILRVDSNLHSYINYAVLKYIETPDLSFATAFLILFKISPTAPHL